MLGVAGGMITGFQIHHGRFDDWHCMPVPCALAMHFNYDLSVLFFNI